LFLYSRQLSSLATNVFYSIVLHGVETACRDAGVSLSLLSVGSIASLSILAVLSRSIDELKHVATVSDVIEHKAPEGPAR
jgi:DNA-binding LacI/PurR family transcriptional regulator